MPQGDKYKNHGALKHLVEIYNKIDEVFTSKDMHSGLHNHWREFEKNDDGIHKSFDYLTKN